MFHQAPSHPALEAADPIIRSFLPEGCTFGYTGNLYFAPYRDNRGWSIFLPHPGRVGTYEDRIGIVDTDNAYLLLAAALILAARGTSPEAVRDARSALVVALKGGN